MCPIAILCVCVCVCVCVRACAICCLNRARTHAHTQEEQRPRNQKHPNTFSVSLVCLIIKSLSVDLQTLLNFLKACKGCYEMLDSLEFPWKVAVEQEFRDCYRDLDITSWIQRSSRASAMRVSALHPLNHACNLASGISVRCVNCVHRGSGMHVCVPNKTCNIQLA